MSVKGSSTRTPRFMARLRALWDAGLSVSAIGEAMEVTRNVVVWLAHRGDFPPRPSPIGGHLTPAERAVRDHEIRAFRASGMKIVDIAAAFKLHDSQVGRIIHGTAYRPYAGRRRATPQPCATAT